MGQTTRDPDEGVPLTPAIFHILLALTDGDQHGYAIMQEITRRTGGKFRIGPGTLYGSIKRLLAEGLIVEVDDRPDPTLNDERRRYYRLTDFGHQVAEAEARRLDELVGVARAKHLLPGAGRGASLKEA